jgi:hypothetical protein
MNWAEDVVRLERFERDTIAKQIMEEQERSTC